MKKCLAPQSDFLLSELPESVENRLPGSGFSKGKPNIPADTKISVANFISGATAFFAATTTSRILLAENVRRAYLFFMNTGTDTIFIAFGNQVDPSNLNAIPISPGGTYEPNTNGGRVVYNAVYIKANSGTQTLVYIEGVNITPTA